jgi:hypothetical protein
MARLDFVAVDTAIKELLALNQNDPSELEIWNYLTNLHRTLLASGQQCMTPEEFFKPQDIAFWKAAWEERPNDKPISAELDLLPLAKLLSAALIPFKCQRTNKMVNTFHDRVEHAKEALHAWLLKNETPAERRARANRAGQQRYLARLKNDGSPQALHAQAVKAAHDKYIDACRKRKEALKQWTDHVNACKQELEQITKNSPLN